MTSQSIYSATPLKDNLHTYHRYCEKGFSSEHVAESLRHLARTLESSNVDNAMLDFTRWDFYQSTKMQTLIDDMVDTGLEQGTPFFPIHLA